MAKRDNGTGWIADYYDKEKLPYPEWLDNRMHKLPRHVDVGEAKENKYFQFELDANEEGIWSPYIIWVIENLEDSWAASGGYIWFESEEDAVAFKLGCL